MCVLEYSKLILSETYVSFDCQNKPFMLCLFFCHIYFNNSGYVFKHAPNTLQRVFATLGRRDILSTTLGLSTEAPPTCSSRLLEAANQKKVIRVNKDYLS